MTDILRYLRPEIDAALTRILGQAVVWDDRILLALSVVTRRNTAPTSAHVWRQLVEYTPAIWRFYCAIGYDPTARPNPQPRAIRDLDPAFHRFSTEAWEQTLRGCLTVRDIRSDDTLTEAAQTALASRRLSLTEFAASILQSGIVGWGSAAGRTTRVRRTNLVLRHIAHASGHGLHKFWSPEVDQLTASFVNAVRGLLTLDESLGQQQFVLFHDGSQYRLRPFGVFGLYKFDHISPLPEGSLWMARGNVLQPTAAFEQHSIAFLENLINREAPEREFQLFFEQHPEYLLVLGDYKGLHPQLIIHAHDGNPLIPDFFLERLDSDFCDILDLKTPTSELVRRQKNRVRFRDAVMEAVAQLAQYRAAFESDATQREFRARYGLRAYHPRVVLIIGRARSYYDDVEQIRLQSQLPAWLELKTFDDVLARARQWRAIAGRH